MNTISFHKLTKRYGPVLAVDDLSFDVPPGRVTGFLGPNGSGKTTTLRILLGLAAPTSGTATIAGLPYRQLPDPMRRVGAAAIGTEDLPPRDDEPTVQPPPGRSDDEPRQRAGQPGDHPGREQPATPRTEQPDTAIPDLRPLGLQVSQPEAEFLTRLGPLLPTPRAAKKLVNLYRLPVVRWIKVAGKGSVRGLPSPSRSGLAAAGAGAPWTMRSTSAAARSMG